MWQDSQTLIQPSPSLRALGSARPKDRLRKAIQLSGNKWGNLLYFRLSRKIKTFPAKSENRRTRCSIKIIDLDMETLDLLQETHGIRASILLDNPPIPAFARPAKTLNTL